MKGYPKWWLPRNQIVQNRLVDAEGGGRSTRQGGPESQEARGPRLLVAQARSSRSAAAHSEAGSRALLRVQRIAPARPAWRCPKEGTPRGSAVCVVDGCLRGGGQEGRARTIRHIANVDAIEAAINVSAAAQADFRPKGAMRGRRKTTHDPIQRHARRKRAYSDDRKRAGSTLTQGGYVVALTTYPYRTRLSTSSS